MIKKWLSKIKNYYYIYRYIAECGEGLKIEGFPQFRGKPEIYLGNSVAIGSYTRFRGAGKIYLDDYVHLSSGVIIDAKEKITIGRYTLIGEYTTITDSDHDYTKKGIERHRTFKTKPIDIGENVWIGGRCAILKGVRIGSNVIVGANTVVTEDVPDNCIVTGVKGTIIKRLSND